MRTVWTVVLVAGGFALQVASYFFLAAPLGVPVDESFSNPRLPFAAALFVIGVIMVFTAALVYELLPDTRE